MQRMLLTATCLAAFAAAAPVQAQPPNDSNISLSAPGLLMKKPKSGAPDVRPQPLAWPRLDAGAVLCRSEDDLNRLARRRAGEVVDGPVDCQIIRAPTAITIIARKGPGQTEVRATGVQDAEPGWTDAWLPDKSPPSRAASANR